MSFFHHFAIWILHFYPYSISLSLPAHHSSTSGLFLALKGTIIARNLPFYNWFSLFLLQSSYAKIPNLLRIFVILSKIRHRITTFSQLCILPVILVLRHIGTHECQFYFSLLLNSSIHSFNLRCSNAFSGK